MGEIKLVCANGALLEAPVREEHARGSNWLAVIDIDGTMPGGLSRRWVDRAKGACLYLVEKLALFDAVEFGADYTTSVGTKRPKRWYGVIVAKTDDFLALEEAPSGKDAALLARAKRIDPQALAASMNAEAAVLRLRAEKLTADADLLARGASLDSFEDFAKRLIERLS